MVSKRNAWMIGLGAGAGLAAYAALRPRPESDLAGQVVLITGGSRGLGLELARQFLSLGCKVAICGRDEEQLARARNHLVERPEASPYAEVFAARCDLSDRDQVEHFVREVNGRFGRIDIVVANAGIIAVGPIDSMQLEDFEQAMSVMFWGALHPIWSVLPSMLERGSGKIVTITSIGGKVSVPHLVPYSCAKFAAVALSEGLRTELRPRGIDVVTIVPGLMRTGSYLNAFFKGRQEREFAWFGLSATLPGMSMDAQRAARQIVTALRRGESERILTLPAQLAARIHGAFPGLTHWLMEVANTMLPSHEGGSRGADPR